METWIARLHSMQPLQTAVFFQENETFICLITVRNYSETSFICDVQAAEAADPAAMHDGYRCAPVQEFNAAPPVRALHLRKK